MRRKLFNIFLILCIYAKAQTGLFINGVDVSFKVDSNSFVSVDGDFYNMKCEPISYVRFNGSLYLTGSFINNDSLKFTATSGSGNSKKARIIFKSSLFTPTNSLGAIIGGSVTPVFWEVELDKGTGMQITLANNIKCRDTLTFKSAFLYMNGYKWNMLDPVGTPNVINHPYIKNERNGSQFMANSLTDTGLVIYKTIFTNSTYINPANIGIEVNGPLNIGSPFNIYRGFKQQVNAAKSSALRYFDIYSSGYSLVNNLLKIKYTYNELNFLTPGYLNLASLTMYASPNTDMNWSYLPSVIQNTMTVVNSSTLNGEMSVNLSDLSLPNTTIAGEAFRITIADPNCMNPPTSSLVLDTIHLCTGSSFILDAGNNTSVANTSLKWEWYTTPAIYTKTLSVSPTSTYQKFVVKLIDVKGCQTIDSIVIAPQSPYPQITYLNHLNACLGDSVIIKDTVKISSGSYTNAWLFSDNVISSTFQQMFKKKFQAAGTHAYQLTATSNYGCSVSATTTNVIVYPLPTANFIHNFNCNTGQMNFTNTSVSNYSTLIISSSNWNFGQGPSNSSTIFSPSQTYSASGTYTVKLIAMSSFGCKDSIYSPITIYPSNQALFLKNNSCLNDTVFFTNTTACNTGSCSYYWQFGDATQSNFFSPKKVYTGPGLYTAKLKVTNPFGCPDSISTNIFINPNPLAQFVNTSTTACLNTFVYLTNTSSVSAGTLSNYSWNFNNTFTNNTTNAVTSYSIPGLYTISLTAVSDSGCVNTFASPFMVQPSPVAQYTVNTVCLGNPSQFNSSSVGSGLSYVWDFGNSVATSTIQNTNQIFTYSSAGTYSTYLIVINTWGCSDTTTVLATVLSSPTLALGGSVSTCGNSYTLNAGNTGANYFWQPGNQTSQYVTVNNSGLYQVNITNTNNCVSTETVQLILNNSVKPHLGNDTTTCGSFLLNAGYPGSAYLWNNFSTNQTLAATSSGSYVVQVTDLNGCLGLDTINLTVLSPAIFNLGNNLTVCKPKYGLPIVPSTNAQSFLWNTGAITSTLTVSTNGLFWCEATSANGCRTRDTILINFLNTPIINLGNHKEGCGSILLDAQNFSCSYLWNTGSAQQVISVQTSSNYWVIVTNNITGCSRQDSIDITIHPQVNVFLGNDTTVCNNSNFSLNAKNSDANYSWTTGASTQTIPINSSGIYGVTVTNSGSCFASDYIYITLTSAPHVDLTKETFYLCGNNPVELTILNSGNVLWQSDKGISVFSNSISINQTGKYWVTVNEFGCSASDSVLILSTSNTIQASFLASTVDTINKPVKFVNLSSPGSTSQNWEFGDGTTSIELNPIHTYVIPDNYRITLEVSNGFCIDRITKELNALFKNSAPVKFQNSGTLELLKFNLFPNPSSTSVFVDLELNDYAEISICLYDFSGKNIAKQVENSKLIHTKSIDLTSFANGIYLIAIEAQSKKGNILRYSKIIKTN